MNHNSMPLSSQEWDEVAAVDLVRTWWGLDSTDRGPELADQTYAAKFDFVSGSPGYVGELYVLTGDSLTSAPLVLIRNRDRQLEVIEFQTHAFA